MTTLRPAFWVCLVALSSCQVYQSSLLQGSGSMSGNGGNGGVTVGGFPMASAGDEPQAVAGGSPPAAPMVVGVAAIGGVEPVLGGAGGAEGSTEAEAGASPQLAAPDLIDDMEDANLFILHQNDRSGAWYSFADSQSAAKVTIELGLLRGSSKYNAHLTSSGFAEYGGMGFALNSTGTPRAYDASAYGGIELWVRVASGSVDVAHLAISDRSTHPQGLECDPKVANGPDACFDDWLAPLQGLTSEWQRFELSWTDLHQAGWGHAGGSQPDVTTLYEVQLEIGPATAVDVWVDDVALLGR